MIQRILLTAALVGAGLGLPGCSDLFGPAEQELRIATDRSDYMATDLGGEGSWRQFGFEVVVRTENVGRSRLYLSSCSPPPGAPIFGVLQVSGGSEGRRGSGFSPAWACPGYPPIELGRGEVRVDTLRLRGPTRIDGLTGEVMGSLDGVKQIGFEVWTCPEGVTCRAADPVGRSNAFRVAIPEGP